MPKFAGVKPKPEKKAEKKRSHGKIVKRPAIPEKVKVILAKSALNLKEMRAEYSEMKLGKSLLEGKFSDVSKKYDRLVYMEAVAEAKLDYISEIKEGRKANEQVSNFEEAVEKFRKDTRTAQKFIERAVGNKLYSLYERVLEYENKNLNKLSDKQREKILTTLENYLEEYQKIKSKFSQIRFSDAKGIDHYVEKMEKIIERNNKH